MDSLKLDIFTPYSAYFSDEVESLSIICDGNSLGILPNHYPLVSTLQIGVLKIQYEGESLYFAIGEGVMNVSENSTSILVEHIEKSNEIDIERALSKKNEIEEKLKSATDKPLIEALQKSLKKAQNRIDVYNKYSQ